MIQSKLFCLPFYFIYRSGWQMTYLSIQSIYLKKLAVLFLSLLVSSFLKLKDDTPKLLVTWPRQLRNHFSCSIPSDSFSSIEPDIAMIYSFLPASIIIWYCLRQKILLVVLIECIGYLKNVCIFWLFVISLRRWKSHLHSFQTAEVSNPTLT